MRQIYTLPTKLLAVESLTRAARVLLAQHHKTGASRQDDLKVTRRLGADLRFDGLETLFTRPSVEVCFGQADLEGLNDVDRDLVMERIQEFFLGRMRVDAFKGFALRCTQSKIVYKGVQFHLTSSRNLNELNNPQRTKMLALVSDAFSDAAFVIEKYLRWAVAANPIPADNKPNYRGKKFHIVGEDRWFSREWHHLLASGDTREELEALVEKMRANYFDSRYTMLDVVADTDVVLMR